MRRPFRWRFPRVIWIHWTPGRSKRPKDWKRRLRVAGMPHHEKPFQPFLPKRIPWTSLGLYAGVLGLAGMIFFNVPARTGPALPVTGHVGIPTKTSWLSRNLEKWKNNPSTLISWLDQGLPLAKISKESSHTFSWHIRSIIMTALSDISGIELNSLERILQAEIPALSQVPSHVEGLTTHSRPLPRPKEQDATDANLPGDNGRIWAELGTKPLVGIYQTHSHEAFWPALPKNSPTAYSTDWSKTVVQVGWWLAQDLNNRGIAVVQSRVDNMSQGLLPSYNESYHTAKRLLKWYPSVHILLDIHRSDKPLDETTAVIHGVKTARILLVVGSNKLLPNPYWHQNLELAIHIAHHLRSIAPGILQGDGIDMVPYRYNQQLAPGDLLIEIGGAYNTLAEERYAVNDLAKAISQVIRDKQYPS
ncbi:stage II sporulation protein P [Sulfobacillus thermosulfidooxidans DSM 9293]|uniref:Stage II sporulation protein P n=1 Tax=Sulfobacillus thermosulfidooxidans (strain DSM 9293 / VKM B-1269 / AT-1) TaxID=929705 RepID=A0A1W1W8N1_SULTA|nr:stage II sporulation protein P [Sulfobacillus thermosulfidooxidans]SMC02552.1 stage II sporulation protein P [Sulfobacillus thermosulfidooxidans DSM 9293]